MSFAFNKELSTGQMLGGMCVLICVTIFVLNICSLSPRPKCVVIHAISVVANCYYRLYGLDCIVATIVVDYTAGVVSTTTPCYGSEIKSPETITST